MTQNDIRRVARKILMGGQKKELIRFVYNREKRDGVRSLAKHMTEISGNRYKARDLMILAGLYIRSENGDRMYLGGKQGKLGGRQNMKVAQVYQSM